LLKFLKAADLISFGITGMMVTALVDLTVFFILIFIRFF